MTAITGNLDRIPLSSYEIGVLRRVHAQGEAGFLPLTPLEWRAVKASEVNRYLVICSDGRVRVTGHGCRHLDALARLH